MTGFIGSGNMASAIIKGMISSEFCKGENIVVFDIDTAKTKALSDEYRLKVSVSAKEVAAECDVVVLCVKPNIFPVLLSEIGEVLKEKDPLIISIAAGKTLGFISDNLPYEPRLIRVMPNINAKVCEAISAFCGNGRTGEEDKTFAENFCNAFGRGIEIDEKFFSIYSAIGGCSPAFCYMFIDSMARAAVKNGMSKKQALEVSAQAMLGSAKMILESDSHPWQLVDEVCSPGGTTIEGVASLQKDGFEQAVINAVEASYNKDKRL